MIDANNINEYIAFIDFAEKNECYALAGLYYEQIGDFCRQTGDETGAETAYISSIVDYAKIKWYSASYKVAVKLGNNDIAFVYAELARLSGKERKKQNRQNMVKKWLDYLRNK